MSIRSILFAGLVLALSAAPASGQTLLRGSDTAAILSMAEQLGPAETLDTANGDPRIAGTIDGQSYSLYFTNCASWGAGCSDLNFQSVFERPVATLESVNAWNRDKRFGKAHVDSDGHAVVEYDITIDQGIPDKTLESAFVIWRTVLDQFGDHLGAD